VADYSENYRTGTTQLRSVSVNFYGDNKRASDATSDDALRKSVSFSKDFVLSSVALVSLATLTSRRSITHFKNEAGEEVADYSENYRTGTTQLRSVSVNFYEDNKRASDATSDDALRKSVSFSKDFVLSSVAGVDSQTLTSRRSITHFKNEAGEEVADFSQNYQVDGTTIRSTVISWYDDGAGGVARAGTAGLDAALRQQHSFRGGVEGQDTGMGALQSINYFVKDVGEEKADFSQSYLGDGTTIRSTTLFYYIGNRATPAGIDAALTEQRTYRGGQAGNDDVVSLGLKLQTGTFFAGPLGEEIADYAVNYRNDGTTILNTTFYRYEKSSERFAADTAVDETPGDWTTQMPPPPCDPEGCTKTTLLGDRWLVYSVDFGSGLDTFVGLSAKNSGVPPSNYDAFKIKVEVSIGGTYTYFGEFEIKADSSIYKDGGLWIEEPTLIELHNVRFTWLNDAADATGDANIQVRELLVHQVVDAADAGFGDALAVTNTYEGDKFTNPGNVLQSQSYFYIANGRGEEITDYTVSFRNDGETVRNTSYSFYEHYVDEALGEDLDGDGVTGEQDSRPGLRQ